MVTSSIDTVLQSYSFVDYMLFCGQTNAISVTVDMQERDYLEIIKSVSGLAEAYGNRFIIVVFDNTTMISEAFSLCATGLANDLTGKGGILSYATFAVD